MNATQRRQLAASIFAAMLAAGQAHRSAIENLNLADAGLTADNWLCVVGLNAVTRVRLRVRKNGQNPDFAFDGTDRTDEWAPGSASHFTGDGTVPFDGAVPKFLQPQNLVCVTPDDFGYWEVLDKLSLKVAGFHGMLPTIDMVQRLIVRFFTGRGDTHQNTWGLPAPGVAKNAWDPPLVLDPRKDAA